MKKKTHKTDSAWQAELGKDSYQVLRKKGTERAFTGAYWDHHAKGMYCCKGCQQLLFSSDTKFESGTGWPSFYQPVDDTAVHVESDYSAGMVRKEVLCHRCKGHLGHVFTDGPQPTGLRYCINSASLTFQPEEKPIESDVSSNRKEESPSESDK